METSTRRRGRRQQTRLWRVPVVRVHPRTPRMVRITVGGPDLADFPATGTDQNVLLYFYDDDVALPEPLTLEAARGMWSQVRPTMRSYTISGHDPAAGEVDFDFVLHGDTGPATSWAAAARPGDRLIFVGPSPNYQPAPDADWYLLAGDETALPAIAATLRGLPAGRVARVFVEVCDEADEQPLPTEADVEIRWLHRGPAAGRDDVLVSALRSATLPPGQADAWLGTERAGLVAARRYLLDELGVPRDHVRATTYWRFGEAGN